MLPVLKTLRAMLAYARPAGSLTELAFCKRFIAPLPGAFQDRFGNYHVVVGESRTLWSAHTDTVHWNEGYQTTHLDSSSGVISLSKRSRHGFSSCLGADDTVGVCLLREMILAGKPGYYIFHYGEECGAAGSSNLADYYGEWLSTSFDRAIALDRRGTTDVITHQLGSRCASDNFAESLSALLGLDYSPTGGLFTDTANYTSRIRECTNLSVGYDREHTIYETVDTNHVRRLLQRLLMIDVEQLEAFRDCSDHESEYGSHYLTWDNVLPDSVAGQAYSWHDSPVCPDCGGVLEVDLTCTFCDAVPPYAGGPVVDRVDCYLDPDYAEIQRALFRAQKKGQLV